MPELPEVETVRRVLAPQLIGRRIERVLIWHPQVVEGCTPQEFAAALTGQAFAGSDRRGKFLFFALKEGGYLALHLRMTGCLLVTPAELPFQPHTHAVFLLSDGRQLRFSDPRRFGRLWYLAPGQPDQVTGAGRLGPEPFDPCLTGEWLAAALKGRRRAIKDCLLDQHLIAGIGNIYGDEILFAAGIHPRRPANTLGTEELARLAQAIPAVLRYFIRKNEISPEAYLDGRGWDYRNTPYFRVYGRGGALCPRCGRRLETCKSGGRTSVFCPGCQPL